jgi:hypothetical protein
MKLGDLVKDKVTGFEGYVTARTEYLDGTTELRLEAPVSKDTDAPVVRSFNAKRLEVITPSGVTV